MSPSLFMGYLNSLSLDRQFSQYIYKVFLDGFVILDGLREGNVHSLEAVIRHLIYLVTNQATHKPTVSSRRRFQNNFQEISFLKRYALSIIHCLCVHRVSTASRSCNASCCG